MSSESVHPHVLVAGRVVVVFEEGKMGWFDEGVRAHAHDAGWEAVAQGVVECGANSAPASIGMDGEVDDGCCAPVGLRVEEAEDARTVLGDERGALASVKRSGANES